MPTIALRSHYHKTVRYRFRRKARLAHLGAGYTNQSLIARASKLSGTPSSHLRRRRNVVSTRNQQRSSRLISLGRIKGRNSSFVRGMQIFPYRISFGKTLNCCGATQPGWSWIRQGPFGAPTRAGGSAMEMRLFQVVERCAKGDDEERRCITLIRL